KTIHEVGEVPIEVTMLHRDKGALQRNRDINPAELLSFAQQTFSSVEVAGAAGSPRRQESRLGAGGPLAQPQVEFDPRLLEALLFDGRQYAPVVQAGPGLATNQVQSADQQRQQHDQDGTPYPAARAWAMGGCGHDRRLSWKFLKSTGFFL